MLGEDAEGGFDQQPGPFEALAAQCAKDAGDALPALALIVLGFALLRSPPFRPAR